jgi:RNA polymerase sigma-B factor
MVFSSHMGRCMSLYIAYISFRVRSQRIGGRGQKETMSANLAGRPLVGAAKTRRPSGGRRTSNLTQRFLLRRYQEKGDRAAREQLIKQSMPLVRTLARRYAYQGEQIEDLIQIGAIGLIKAIDRFDLSRGVTLQTYAATMITGELKRHFRDQGLVRVPRGLKELNVELSMHADQLTADLGRVPTMADLANAAGVDEEKVLEALESRRAYGLHSLSPSVDSPEEDLDPLELIGGEDRQYEVVEDRAVLATGVKTLADREQRVLQLHFYEELTQSQIAHQIGMSQMSVSRLIRSALEHIRKTVIDEEKITDDPASAASSA